MPGELKGIPSKILLKKYKRLARNAPFVAVASDKELDIYYSKLIELEEEIIRRIEGN